MKRQEALERIARAGLVDDALKAVSAIQERADREFATIRSDTTRSDDYTRQELARAHLATQKSIDAKLVDLASKAGRQDQQDAERVFGTLGLSGDSASLTISRRDAADRVAAIGTKSELRELLARATRTGDEVLARAVAERATELRDVDTMNQFLSDRPTLEAAGERLWSAQAEGEIGDTMMLGWHLAAGRPAELGSMQSWEIERLAGEAG